MYSYLVRYNNNIIGCYNDIEGATQYIKSCYQNKFMKSSATIVKCLTNTCLFEDEVIIKYETKHFVNSPDYLYKSETQQIQLDSLKSPTSYSQCKTLTPNVSSPINILKPNMFLTSQYDKTNELRSELQHEINILKQKKIKLEQSKKVYETDIEIYRKFKTSHTNDSMFIIPEIFKKKYDLFVKLEDENKLSWENFVNEYKHDNMYNDHFNVTYHEELYSNANDKDEVFEIDS